MADFGVVIGWLSLFGWQVPALMLRLGYSLKSVGWYP